MPIRKNQGLLKSFQEFWEGLKHEAEFRLGEVCGTRLALMTVGDNV
jgi:hypothetical protein